MEGLIDEFGRRFKTLRVSLINTCNLGCVYCTCGTEDLKDNLTISKAQGISAGDLSAIIKKLHRVLKLDTVRFTGGEPLLYHQLPEIIRSTRLLGIDNLKLTTNGLLLENQAAALAEAGLRSINISLDAIDEEVFYSVSRRHGINRILKGIDTAIDEGLEVKLNAVIMRGLNENQIIPLLKFAFERNIRIRFLEIMAMGHLFGKADEHFFSQDEILSEISKGYDFERLERKPCSTANYWKTTSGYTFGIVANETEPFCGDCDRLRLDSLGNIYGCLSSNSPVSVNHIHDDAALIDCLQAAMSQKQSLKFTGSNLSMLSIGG